MKAVKNIMKGKKGGWVLYLSTLGIIAAYFIFLTTDVAKGTPLTNRAAYLGQNQLGILRAESKMQEHLFFIDNAAKIASRQMIYDLGQSGGSFLPMSCGEYKDYPLWQVKKQNQVSSSVKANQVNGSSKQSNQSTQKSAINQSSQVSTANQTTQATKPPQAVPSAHLLRCRPIDLDQQFTENFNPKMNELLKGRFEIPKNNYEIRLSDGPLKVFGIAKNSIDMSITKESSSAVPKIAVPPLRPGRVVQGEDATIQSKGASIIPVQIDPSRGPAPKGIVVDGISMQTDWGNIILEPTKFCPDGKCKNALQPELAINENNKRTMVVIHCTGGMSGESALQTWLNKYYSSGKKKRVATHYILDRDGTYLMVAKENWYVPHTPGSLNGRHLNANAIGIETANTYDLCPKLCWGKLCSQEDCKLLTQAQRDEIDSAHKKLYGAGNLKRKKYEEYGDEQMRALVKLTAEIMIRNNIALNDVVRHSDASVLGYSDHGDPGPAFPWIKFKENLANIIKQYNENPMVQKKIEERMKSYASATGCYPGQKICFMGDSLTAGNIKKYTYKFPALVQKHCSESTVLNKGIGSQRISQMLARFKTDIIDQKCNHVVILAGANDLVGRASEAKTRKMKADLQAMYDMAANAGIRVVAMTTTPFNGYKYKGRNVWSQSKQDVQDEINNWIRSKPNNVDVVIDAYALLENPNQKFTLDSSFKGDYLHFGAKGHTKVANELEEKAFRRLGQ